MRAAVIIFPGSNCDRDLLAALRFAGHETISIWHKETELPKTYLMKQTFLTNSKICVKLTKILVAMVALALFSGLWRTEKSL